MKIHELKIDCNMDRTCVSVWARCTTSDEIDMLIEWLKLAKNVMLKWEKINAAATTNNAPTAG